jgi:hypothetical protein
MAFTSATIPHNRSFALIGNANRSDIAHLNATLVQSVCHNHLHALPDFLWVVFDPARLRVNLPMLFLSDGNNSASRIENHTARAGGALVNSSNVPRQMHLFALTALVSTKCEQGRISV